MLGKSRYYEAFYAVNYLWSSVLLWIFTVINEELIQLCVLSSGSFEWREMVTEMDLGAFVGDLSMEDDVGR